MPICGDAEKLYVLIYSDAKKNEVSMARTDNDTWDLASRAEAAAIGDAAPAFAAMSCVVTSRK